MPTSEQDQKYVETALLELKDYLLSDTLFYPLTGNLPRLTIGGLLLAQKRLDAENLGTHLAPKLDSVKNKWRAAWAKKAAQELDSRLNLWRNFLSDYRANPEIQSENYPHEIRWRVMLELLKHEVDEVPDEITALDGLLRTKFLSGDFIWEDSLQSEFSQDEFWFLYGRLS